MYKKISLILILIMLLFSGCSKAEYSSTPIDLKTGEVLSVKVSMEESGAIKSMALSFSFDEDTFELTDGEWLSKQAVIADFNIENKDAVIAFIKDTNFSGEIFELELKAKKDITVTDDIIAVETVLKNEQLSIECKGISLSFLKK